MMETKIKGSWLTVNRKCNISCEWCYAKNSPKTEMSLSNATKLLSFLEQLGVKRVIIIGGEPTLYKHLPELIKNAASRNMQTVLITNGILIADESYIEKLAKEGLNRINISLKGYDRESYYKTTGCDKYEEVLQGIRFASKYIKYNTVSFVLTSNNIERIHKGIKDAVDYGASNIGLSFCYNFDTCHSDFPTNNTAYENPYELASLFENNYSSINKAANSNFNLFQTLPLCVWNEDFLKILKNNHQISSICQLLCKNGLIFDTDMTLIPCNAMYNTKLGKFGNDFSDNEQFCDFWQSKNIQHFYNKITAYPDKKCIDCNHWKNCGGGCISNWFNYSFKELEKMRI